MKTNAKIYDIEILRKNGLVTGNEVNDNYYKVYSVYRELLERYLIKKLNLQEYDNELGKSELQFTPVDLDSKDYYQKSSTLKYFYIRNDICVEKIPNDIILQILRGEATEDIIESTYKSVIDNNMRTDATLINCYGDDIPEHWHDSRDLIIGFRYDEFYDDGLSDEDWLEKNNKQCEMINRILKEIKEKGTKELEINVQALWLDPETKGMVL